MATSVDTLVIGAGPGGYVAAIRLGQLGVKTLVIEREELGGVCLNVGCIPSKALISAGKLHKKAKEGEKFGLVIKEVGVDAKKLQEFKTSVVKKMTGGIGQLFKANKVEHLYGEAVFKDANTVEVKTRDGKSEKVTFKHCIVATGGRPIQIPGFEFDEDRVLSSTGALELAKIPKEIVIIGGGVIGLEIGCMLHNFGTKVTVIEMLPELLPGSDDEVAKTLHRLLKKRGMEIYTDAKATGMKKTKSSVTVDFEAKDGKKQSVKADHVLVAVGRRPNTDSVGLEKAGVKVGERGLIAIDHQGRTNVKHIFAIGDIVPGLPLAHKASKEGIVVAEVIAGKKSALDHKTIPAVVFTDPEVAWTGMSEKEAKEAGRKVKIGKFPFGANGRAVGNNEADGFTKLITDAETGEVLGCTIIGPDASDLIAEPTLAVEMGAFTEDIALTVHAHPTLAETLMEAAEHAQGHAIHTANR